MKPRIANQPEINLISPEGKPVRTSEYFECPAEIIIGENGVSFDGWVFRTDTDIAESDIAWLAHQIAILHETQGTERAESLVAALERLISTPIGVIGCHTPNRMEMGCALPPFFTCHAKSPQLSL